MSARVRLARTMRWAMVGSGVACGYLGLQEVGASGIADFVGAVDGRKASANEELVPVGSVLIEEEDWFAGRADAGSGAGGLNLHEGDQAVNFWFGRSEFGEDAAKAERVFAEGGAHEIVAGGGGVALVEDEVDNFED